MNLIRRIFDTTCIAVMLVGLAGLLIFGVTVVRIGYFSSGLISWDALVGTVLLAACLKFAWVVTASKKS